ncbi:MAG: response regulator transcription factor [Myxococcota bacterium]
MAERILRVAIADDHPIVRDGLHRIVSACHDLEVVAEIASGFEVVERLESVAADVLLLDISMPGPGFLELLEEIRKAKPRPAVLVLSAYQEEAFAVRVRQAGATGFLNKQRSSEDLADAIRAVGAGDCYFGGRAIPRAACEREVTRIDSVTGHLSPREFEVFLLLGAGLRVTDIASRLELSPKTVSTHRARILEKTGFQSNAEIVRYAASTGLVEGT